MATLKQAVAIIRISQRLGKPISYDEASKWSMAEASRFIGKYYVNYYDVIREKREEEHGRTQ